MEDTARRVAEFTAGLEFEDVPDDVVETLEAFVLDNLRLTVVGSQLEWSASLRSVFAPIDGAEEATALVFGDRLPAINAAYMNGFMSHTLENDDTHVGAIHHPGVVVIPATLALAEREGADGEEFLAAIAAGYEVMIRVGLAVNPSLYFDRGFHSTAVCGHFGAAAAAASLLDLSVEETHHAMGFAASYASGMANWFSGGTVKYVHTGKAAKAGVECGLLADAGLAGPRDIFEGKRAFCSAYADEYVLEEIYRGFGEEWLAPDTHLKPHASSRHTQASIEAAARVADDHDISPADVEHIEVVTNPEMAEPMDNPEPEDVIQAQSSIPFVVALAVHKGGGRTLEEFLLFEDILEGMDDPEVAALIERVDLQGDPAFDVQAGNARATIRTTDGNEYSEQVDVIRGSPQNPFTWEELEERFLDQAGETLPRDRLEEVAESVRGLESLDGVDGIVERLTE